MFTKKAYYDYQERENALAGGMNRAVQELQTMLVRLNIEQQEDDDSSPPRWNTMGQRSKLPRRNQVIDNEANVVDGIILR
ncbi:MAG: hypothetical protein Phog2KO_48470 [Phototrophicaceae bacterium]